MKLRYLWTAILASTLGNFPARAIDFTLRNMNVASEGMTLSSSYITDGDNKIMLRIPGGWKANDSPAALVLIPAQANSQVTLAQVHVQALPLDPAGQDALAKEVLKSIPSSAKKVEAQPVQNDVLPIRGWTSVELVYRYELFGQSMRRSVVFINMLPGRVVQWTTAAPDAVFDAVHEQARVLMFNWFEPKRELSPKMAREYEEGGGTHGG